MTIEIWLVLALILSVSANVFFVWFSTTQSRKLSYVSQNLGDLVEIVMNYKEHLRKVYSLEMFYGDETLKMLMDHTNALVTILQEEYGDITYITDPLEIEFIKEENEKKEEKSFEEDVFYAGSRERNT